MAPRTPSSVHPPANDDVNERAVRKVELSKYHLQFQAEMRNSVMRNNAGHRNGQVASPRKNESTRY